MNFCVSLNNMNIVRVYHCKYLGMFFNDEMTLCNDIEKCHKTFLQQFNAMFFRFNFVNRNQLTFLFESYCMSFYGGDLWYGGLLKLHAFNTISTVYHKALKRVVGLSPYHNNHDAASMSGLMLFKHLIASRCISFLFQLIRNKSACLVDLKDYFKYDSFMSKTMRKYFNAKYNIDNIFENELCAIKARIRFVQRNEASSGYIP